MIDVVPPPSSSPEIVGDVQRSSSYSLTRGGKVISSQPWSFHYSKVPSEVMQDHSSSGSSPSTSDSENSSSASSSGDELPNKKVVQPNARECRKCSSKDEKSSSEDSDDTDSEETESTVIVCPLPPLTDELLDEGKSPPITGDELNDTLSSVNEDFSFDHERSPSKEEAMSANTSSTVDVDTKFSVAFSSEDDSQLSRSFEFYSELRDVTLTVDSEINSNLQDKNMTSQMELVPMPNRQRQRSLVNSPKTDSTEVYRESSSISHPNEPQETSSIYRRNFVSSDDANLNAETARTEDSVSYHLHSPLVGKAVGRPPPSPSSTKAKLNKSVVRNQLPINNKTVKEYVHRLNEGKEKFSGNHKRTVLPCNASRQQKSNRQFLKGSGLSSSHVKARNGNEIGPISLPLDYEVKELNGSRGSYSHEGSPIRHYPSGDKQRYSLSPSKVGNAESDYRRNQPPHHVYHGSPHCHEDSDLSDVSSGATSEDSAIADPSRYCSSQTKGDINDWSSPMLTGLVDGHVTRLATPPDHRVSSHLNTHCDDGSVASYSRHTRPRPPPVPRPRTMEGSEMVPCRVYSPQRHTPNFHSPHDNSLERNGKDTLSELSNSHRYQLRSHHRPHSNPREAVPLCWCEEEEEERDYDSCDERHHHHRHSYHEGLHHAHLLSSPHPQGNHKRHHTSGMRLRRSVSPCYDCRRCPAAGTLATIPDSSCFRIPRALPYNGVKVGVAIASPKLPDSDYIPLWNCHSPLGIEERLQHLEGDKESLQLQVSVLGEQVEAQTEKIQDLEGLLEHKKMLIQKTEEQLQKEVMTRSSLETQRLELLSEISNLKLRHAATERENLDLRDKLRLSELTSPDRTKNQLGVLGIGSPTSISTFSLIPKSNSNPGTIVYTNNVDRLGLFHRDLYSGPSMGGSDWDKLPPRTPPPNARRKIDQFGTIPRQQRDLIGGSSTMQSHMGPVSTTGRVPKGVMFGKGFNQFVSLKGSGKRSTSAPNLAETEKQNPEISGESNGNVVNEKVTENGRGASSTSPFISRHSPSVGSKPTGIKKIFTRLRRSSSGHLENAHVEGGDLKRGGMRATATARLGWTSQTGLFREPLIPFSSWTSRHIEEWFVNLGLSQYSAAARCFMESGKHLSKATPHQIEKDVGVRHPLHRKKLQLAISNRVADRPSSLDTACSKLDNAWVLRWLDDVALPQYKDVFSEARIDGLVLNYLTFDDLAFLKIINLLHITSLKRGIQLLRVHNFDPSVLKRRSSEEEKLPWTPTEVSLWTNHRVMEWLKTVDLSEYAPNLRGSGVHGALMVYEPRFTSEFLASLLSISSTKTLLRRHLNTHFKELVGSDVVQCKRELQVSPGYIPLTTTAKIKMPRKSQFSLKRRKTKSDLEFDDLLCPLDELPPKLGHYNPIKETSLEMN